VQWYGNVPADENVLEKLAPGAIDPEFQPPPSAVDVCVVLSLFIQVTVPPTETAIGFGTKAVEVKLLAPLGIETVTPPGVGDGVGDGVGEGAGDGDGDGDGDGLDGEDADPQPVNEASSNAVPMIRIADMCCRSPAAATARRRPSRCMALCSGNVEKVEETSYGCLHRFRAR